MDSMKTVILCGGQGTRLREETEFRPKPLVEVGGRPILWHVMKLYAHYGLKDFVLCLGYRGAMIKEYFLNYEAMNNDFTISLGKSSSITYHEAHTEQDFNVTLAMTGENTMTGGRIQKVRRYLNESPFMVSYGDTVADIDIGRLLEFHRSHGKIATVSAVRPASRFGVMELNSSGGVGNFAEKPRLEGWVSAGFFVFEPGIFDYLEGDQCILERAPLERLVADNQLMAYQHSGAFYVMDTYREYRDLNDLWDQGRAPWKRWED